ncbi:MAG: hypothetical protein KDA37_08445 [Planctomycetales bacterium]|nr:hypothetical protein [Planctomycetales bacterium]
MRLTLLAAGIVALGLAGHAQGQLIFSEDFDDGSAASRWTSPIVDAETSAFDGSVDYAYDYGALGVPAAPGGGASTGVLMQVNLTDDTARGEGESVGIIPTVAAAMLPSGSYSVTMDVFFNVEAQSAGTTEYGIFGVHTAAVNAPGDASLQDDVPFRFGLSNGNGLAWSATGDAGAADDFYRFEDAGNANAGSQVGLGSYDNLPAGAIPGVSTGQGAAGPAGAWVEVELVRVGDKVAFKMNGYEIDSIVDASNAFSGGSIMIGYSDPFNSAGTPDLPVGPDPDPFDNIPYGDQYPNLAHFIIFDNVKITQIVPEPSTALLGLCGLVLWGVRRRG